MANCQLCLSVLYGTMQVHYVILLAALVVVRPLAHQNMGTMALKPTHLLADSQHHRPLDKLLVALKGMVIPDTTRWQ